MSAFGVILLQKSKIERRRKSRQGGFLDAPAAARLSGTNTKAGGCFGMKRCGPSRLSARSASAVFNIFAIHPKNTFATISATSGQLAASGDAVVSLIYTKSECLILHSRSNGSL